MKPRIVSLGISLLFGWSGCGMQHGGGHGNLPPAPAMIVPDAWSGALKTASFTDLDASANVVEVNLTASVGSTEYLPGKPVEAWTYNGTVPGPTLEANVGDKIVVHFKNDLPEATTIHWHGMRVPNAMDGSARVQTPVLPGGSFTYEFVATDAGTFWYHPHVRTDVQVGKGLYGGIVVRDASEPAIDVAADEMLVLDDVHVDPTTGALDESKDARIMMMGKEGNLGLVNGARSNVGLDVKAGERRRWRIVNTATARFFKLALSGGEMTRLGGDDGLLGAPATITELLLTPGERADLVVSVPAPGQTATLKAVPYERATGAGSTESIDLVRLVAGAEPAATPVALPTKLRDIPAAGVSTREREIRLGETMGHSHVQFTINGATFPDVPVIEASLGTTETWSIVNESEMDHPFHLHGFHFRENGGADEWKDTINVRGKATIRLAVDFGAREGGAGGWMYHCHILEHEEGGMMAEVLVK